MRLGLDPTPRKKIFMHIHKCAGTSLYRTLGDLPGFVCCVARPGDFPYRLSREYIPDEIWAGAFRFTFVRNPYSRLVSAFKMFSSSPPWARTFRTFDEFVEFLRWADVDAHRVDREYRSELEFTDTIGNVIHHCSSFHNPKYRLGEMHFVGRLESMESDLMVVARELGVERIELPRLNPTAPGDYRAYYTPRTREIVAAKYRRDLERFGYEF